MKISKLSEIDEHDIVVFGIPFDDHSSYLRGPALAPKRIIEALLSDSSNTFSETLVDVVKHKRFKWLGEASISDYDDIGPAVQLIMKTGAIPIFLGGDHSITYPIIREVRKTTPALTILHLDAHSDLYEELDNNRFSHACPFARIMENGLADRLVQLGIRTLNDHQKMQADRYNVEIIQMKDWCRGVGIPSLTGPVYISLDMDVIDPAYAPGVSHHEPGGLSTRDMIQLIQSLDCQIMGIDLVEYNPTRDINDMTAMVASKLLKELFCRIDS
jgi:agmatinase